MRVSRFLRQLKLVPSFYLTNKTYRFVVEDENYNYISARYPGDAELFAEEIIKLFESFHKIV